MSSALIQITTVTPAVVLYDFKKIIDALSLDFILVKPFHLVVLSQIHPDAKNCFFYTAQFGDLRTTTFDLLQIRAMLKAVASLGLLSFELFDSVPNSPFGVQKPISLKYLHNVCITRLMSSPRFSYSSEKIFSEIIYICTLILGPFTCIGRSSDKDLAKKSAILIACRQFEKYNYVPVLANTLTDEEKNLFGLRARVEDSLHE